MRVYQAQNSRTPPSNPPRPLLLRGRFDIDSTYLGGWGLVCPGLLFWSLFLLFSPRLVLLCCSFCCSWALVLGPFLSWNMGGWGLFFLGYCLGLPSCCSLLFLGPGPAPSKPLSRFVASQVHGPRSMESLCMTIRQPKVERR